MPLWLLTIGKAAFAPVAALWRYLAADWHRMAFAVLIALCAFLGWRLHSVDGSRDDWRDKTKSEVAAHKVTLESVKTLRDALDQKNAESLARAKALQDARSEAAQAQADAERRYATTKARIDALRAAVGQNGDDCSVPGEVSDALAGL